MVVLLNEAFAEIFPSDVGKLFLLPCKKEEEQHWCFSEVQISLLVLS